MPGVPGEIACGTGNEIGLPYTARLEVAGEATTPRASFIYVPYLTLFSNEYICQRLIVSVDLQIHQFLPHKYTVDGP